MRWPDGITDNGHEFEQTPGDGEQPGSLVCCSPPGCKELDMTQQLNNRNNNPFLLKGSPGGLEGKGYACHAGDLGSISGLGRSLEK